VSEQNEPEVHVPTALLSGVIANDVDVFHDIDYSTLDFVRIDPRRRDRTIVVARLVVSSSCILKLRHELAGAR
jgi:hypothetical protein